MSPQNDAISSSTDLPTAKRVVYVANLFDTSNLKWADEIFNLAVDLINDHQDGWFDDVLDDGTVLVATSADSGCDPRTSLPAYWNLRTNWDTNDGDGTGGGMMPPPPIPHGVVCCRCTEATAAVARVAGIEGVTVVSPTSSAADLSDPLEFSSLARLVGPDDERGQVGALVSLFRSMGWDRVHVLATDTKYTKDLASAFGSAWVGEHSDADGIWTGEVKYSHTIALGADRMVNETSVRRALNGVPITNPRTNSRVILLLAHHQHTYPILKIAKEMNFQPDTIWIGTAAWSDRLPIIDGGDTLWMPSIPGYLGLVPYRNRDGVYQDFLERLQLSQKKRGQPVMEDLPDYSAEMIVDSLLALVMALSRVSPELRRDGQAVLSELRNVAFSGLSGPVSFTEDHDRANPHYSVMNWRSNKESKWAEVGNIGITLGSASVRLQDICWPANLGCGLDVAPSDKYPLPPLPAIPAWVWVIVSVLVASVLVGVYLSIRLRRSRQKIKDYFEEHVEVAEAKRNIEGEIERKEEEIDELKERLTYLVQQPLDPQDKPRTWSDSTQIIVEVKSNEREYQSVSDKLRESMDDARVTKLYRIQNHPLWIYYNFHKRRLRNCGVANSDEVMVWHGTRGNDPAQVCTDIQDGFLMQYAQEGLWGRGIYFAEKSAYSDGFAFRPAAAHSVSGEGIEGPVKTKRCANAEDGERELILARLLVGQATFIERPRPDLKVPPPIDHMSSQRYNTVWSFTRTQGKDATTTKVWIVYENGRAFPEYLVRYTRGSSKGDT